MMKSSKLLGLGMYVVLAASCGKKSSSKSDAPEAVASGVTPATGSQVSLSGQLNLEAASLDDDLSLADPAARKVLAFTLIGGKVTDAPQAVEVDSSGKFSLKMDVANSKLVAAKAAVAQSPIDKAPLKIAFPSYASEIEKSSDAELKSGLSELLAEMEASGGPQYVVVSYMASGDALEEAKSFRFVGLPSSGNNVMSFPADALKGNLNLGKISGSGEDVTAELKADEKVFKLDDSAIAQLANVGQTLKVVKNFWVNKNADGKGVSIEAQPFFGWSGKLSGLVDGAATNPVDMKYSGYGMYVGAKSFTAAAFDELCPSGGTYDSPKTSSKLLTLTPPADVHWSMLGNDGKPQFDVVMNASHPLNNGKVTRQQQNDKSVCNGSDTGFYARDDGDSNFMLNWGTGASLQGAVPKGFWDLKLEGASKAKFDLYSAYPLDADGNSKVYVPVVTLHKSGEKVTGVDVKFMIYRPSLKAYEEVKDVAFLKRVAGEIAVSFSVVNGSGSDEKRGVLGRESENDIQISWDGATIKAVAPANLQVPLTSQWEVGKISSIAVGFAIGTTNYRYSWWN